MPDIQQSRRNSSPNSLTEFLTSLEEELAKAGDDRRRELEKDPSANVRWRDKLIRDLEIRIEVVGHVIDAYGALERARDSTHDQSSAQTRVEITKLLLRIDEYFARKA